MQPLGQTRNDALNYYTILGLPQPQRNTSKSLSISKDDLKSAYHQTLLLHHPDKALINGTKSSTLESRVVGTRYAIDEIMRAYQTLSEPRLKAEYDKHLLSHNFNQTFMQDKSFQKGVHLGVEVFDLEDLTYDDETRRWYRSCRCGDQNGYILTEEDLEKESSEGEIYVGCHGCSLFIKILFEAVEEEI